MGSGPKGREWVDAAALAPGSYLNGRMQEIELFGDGLIERPPHCTDAFTPVSISHFTPGLLPDRICSATSFYPQIHNQQPPVKGGYSVLSVATLPPTAPSPLSQNLSPASLPCRYQPGNSMVLLQINNQYCINASTEATWS